MRIKRQLPKGKIFAIVGMLILLAAGGLWLLKVRQENADQQANQQTETSRSQTETDQSTPQPETTPQPPKQEVKITLPNATAIAARVEDYTQDTSIWKLANKDHGYLVPTYVPADLAMVPTPTMPGRGQDERSLRQVTFDDLQKMVAAAKAEGLTLQLGSGYRSYATQQVLFSNYSRQYGEAAAARFSARPGHSEHQSGLAADFVGASGACWVSECFESQPEGKWLAAHAHEYGFILRYPKGKQSIVGYQYEPWHFRYVGRELAGALKQSGLTLEEAWPHLEKALSELKEQGKI